MGMRKCKNYGICCHEAAQRTQWNSKKERLSAHRSYSHPLNRTKREEHGNTRALALGVFTTSPQPTGAIQFFRDTERFKGTTKWKNMVKQTRIVNGQRNLWKNREYGKYNAETSQATNNTNNTRSTAKKRKRVIGRTRRPAAGRLNTTASAGHACDCFQASSHRHAVHHRSGD